MSPFVEGVRDLLPGEIAERRWIYQNLREIFSKNGFLEVATPTLESLDLYTEMEAILAKEQMFKVVDETGQILVLRPDVTMPIARLAATSYNKIPKPWKFSYITTAYQANRGLADHMKEKTQAGIEFMGRSDLQADVEVIGVLIRVLQEVGIKEPQIDIGQAAFVEEIFANLNLDESTKLELRNLMEEKNIEEIKMRIQEWNLSEEEKRLLLNFPNLFGEPEEVIEKLRRLPLTQKALKVVEKMEELYFCLKGIGLVLQYITFDPMMVTHLGYYTSFIFQAYVKGYGEVIASGGRYDGLASKFGLDIPAVGFAIEIERVMICLNQFQISKIDREPRIVLEIKDDNFVSAYLLAERLKTKGIIVELYNGQGLDEYCKFHQIHYQGEWNGERLVLQDQTGYRVKFEGSLDAISQNCLNYCLGGQKI